MFGVTPMARSVNQLEKTQSKFGGYDHRDGAGDGTIWDCNNMSTDKFPLLTTRPLRARYDFADKPNGMYLRDCVCWVDGTQLIVDKQVVGEVADSRKILCGIQDKICIWPDKVLYDRGTGELRSMEASWTGAAVFADGTYAGEPALANTVRVPGDLRELFRAGDGVTVTVDGTDEGPYIIREVAYSADAARTELRFYEETWRGIVGEPEEGTETEKETVTIRRSIPDLDLVFEHHNRLWGAKGSTVYACALGDPTNWQTFDNISTDAYELTVGSPGEITGGCSYGGRPVFFKERSIIKIYGDGPSSWQTSQTQSVGVEKGSGKSLAVAGDVLFYKSTEGIMTYSGGYPRRVAEELGTVAYRNATAGSDGVRYYVAMERVDDGGKDVFCYDTRYGVWHPESGMAMVDWGWNGTLYAMEERGMIWRMRSEYASGDTGAEGGMKSWVEFADWSDGTLRRKMPAKLLLRLEADLNVEVTVQIQYDSDGVWRTVRQLVGALKKQQIEIPVQLRRCDHYRLRIEGMAVGWGGWTLHALTWIRSAGSNRK